MDYMCWRVFLPYCAQKLKNGSYILLGRDHKPVGCLETRWSKWEEHPIVYEVEGLTPKMAAQLSWNRNSNVERIYFYNAAADLGAAKSILKRTTSELRSFWRLPGAVVCPSGVRRASASWTACVHG